MTNDDDNEISTANDFMMGWDGVRIQFILPVNIETKQQGYRTIALMETLLNFMPDEEGAHTLDQIREGVQNS